MHGSMQMALFLAIEKNKQQGLIFLGIFAFLRRIVWDKGVINGVYLDIENTNIEPFTQLSDYLTIYQN